jgi:nicotinamide mononucleotide (NMN) deamidase PncC
MQREMLGLRTSLLRQTGRISEPCLKNILRDISTVTTNHDVPYGM